MEAVMDWSYSLLSVAERKLFVRLGVFSGSFSLQAAEEICQGQGILKEEILNLLAGLVDKSLVGTLPSFPETRFRLHEIVRQYAHQKLYATDRFTYWNDRHLDYFVRLAETAEPKLRGSEQLEWFNRLELELENLRGALLYAFDGSNSEEQGHTIEAAASMVGALWLFWFIRGRFSEGRHWAERVLASLERTKRNSPKLGKVLNTAASFCYFQGEYSLAEELSQRSLVVCRSSTDLFGELISHHHLGLIANVRGDAVLAGNELNQGLKLAKSLDDPWLISLFQSDISWVAGSQGDQSSRLAWQQQALETARQSGDKFGILYSLLNITQTVLDIGDVRQAAMLAEESLVLARELGEKRGISFALGNLGLIAMQEGAYPRAGELLKQSLQIIWSTRDRDSILSCLVDLAENASYEEKFELTARLLAACESAQEAYLKGYRFSNQSTYSRLVEMLPNQLEEGTLMAAWTLGRLMSLEQAVAYALKDHQ
jgi:tetratricopeptide (TPR) repeat protein